MRERDRAKWTSLYNGPTEGVVEKRSCFLYTCNVILVLLQRDKLMRFKTLAWTIELWPLDY